ncbi:MAG: hypothetical protein ACK519_00390 [Sphingomonadaceae bacterium]|jgi:hypothetical protein
MPDFKIFPRKAANAQREEDKENLLLCVFAALRDKNFFGLRHSTSTIVV